MRAVQGRHHRQADVAGPVTTALKVAGKPHPKPLSTLLRAWPAVALVLVVPLLRRSPHLTQAEGDILGLDATLCLIACMTITPLTAAAGLTGARASRLRWWYGVWMFALGATGLALAVAPQPMNPMGMAAGTSVNWTGLLIVVLLLPMAVTSNVTARKLLGPEWKRWQRWLIWGVWYLVAVHLTALQAWPTDGGFLAATLPLIILRWRKNSIKQWRLGRYEGGWWWFWLGVLGSLYTAGVVLLTAELARACVSACA